MGTGRGACLETCTAEGNRALHFASRNGHLEVVRALLSARADVNPTSGPSSLPSPPPVSSASKDVKSSCLGANGMGCGPARQRRFVPAVVQTNSPLDLAYEAGHTDVIAFLEAHGALSAFSGDPHQVSRQATGQAGSAAAPA